MWVWSQVPGSRSAPVLQTIYNAITNGTPCVIVEGSGRVADVIAQVASLPISEITISLIQQKLGLFFQEMFETFTESRIVEWTKKVRHTGTSVTRRGPAAGRLDAVSLVSGTRACQNQTRRPQRAWGGHGSDLQKVGGCEPGRQWAQGRWEALGRGSRLSSREDVLGL